MAGRLEDLDNHDGLLLLRHCMAIPKLLYFLRSAPCFKSPALLEEYDTVMRNCLEKILNVQLDQVKHLQGSLPVKWGGLGISRATDLALPAFLASAHGARAGILNLLEGLSSEDNYQEVTDAEELWKGLIIGYTNNNEEANTVSPFPTNKTVQAEWDSALYQHIYNNMLAKETVPAERARLLAIASEEASNWMNAIPVPDHKCTC